MRRDERLVAPVRDLETIDVERRDKNFSERPLVRLGVWVIAAHQERSRRHEDHSWRWRVVFLRGQPGLLEAGPRSCATPDDQRKPTE